MFGFRIDKAKGMFFDRKPVMAAVSKATRTVLSRFGAFVRTRARSSIRKRRKVSQPGQPPSSHTGLLKRFIYFVFEPKAQSVVIGPAKLSKPGSVPEVLEHGGRVSVFQARVRGQWRTVSKGRRTAGLETRTRRVTVAARPSMQPAFDAEKPKLSSLWRNSVKA